MTSLDELETRVRLLEDERELRELLAHFGFTADLGHSLEWTDLWTDDGVYDLGPRHAFGNVGAPEEFGGRFVGHDDLFWNEICGRPHKLVEGYSQHHAIGPIEFDIDGDHATAVGYGILVVRSSDRTRQVIGGWPATPETNIAAAGFDRWKFRRVNGRWRIKERSSRLIGSAEAEQIIFG